VNGAEQDEQRKFTMSFIGIRIIPDLMKVLICAPYAANAIKAMAASMDMSSSGGGSPDSEREGLTLTDGMKA